MYEFEAVSVSSYDAGSLAAKLTEKSAEGWDVVAIVPAGSDVTAYLKKSSRGAGASSSSTDSRPDRDASYSAGPSTASSPTAEASEPSGWGSAPSSSNENAASSGGWGSASSSTPSHDTGSSTGSWGSSAGGTAGGSSGWGGSSGTPAGAPTQVASTPSVPPGWYADPAGRYELRYWDGSSWTEHVSRAGQQYTDPPVA